MLLPLLLVCRRRFRAETLGKVENVRAKEVDAKLFTVWGFALPWVYATGQEEKQVKLTCWTAQATLTETKA